MITDKFEDAGKRENVCSKCCEEMVELGHEMCSL